VEFSLVYRLGPGKNGAGGQYWLYSGVENKVFVPIADDPKGSIGASGGDRNVMKELKRVGSPPEKFTNNSNRRRWNCSV